MYLTIYVPFQIEMGISKKRYHPKLLFMQNATETRSASSTNEKSCEQLSA